MEGFGYAALLVTSSALDSGIGIESLRTLIARVGKAIFEHSDLEDFFEKKKTIRTLISAPLYGATPESRGLSYLVYKR